MERALKKMYEGALNLMYGVSTFDEYGDKVVEVINGETEEGYALEKYFFNRSLDEEMSLWLTFIEELGNKYSVNVREGVREGKNSVEMMRNGLELLIEGVEEIVNLVREDEGLKKELKDFVADELQESSDAEFNIFSEYGFSYLERRIRGFAYAYNKELKDKLGKYEYYKALGKEWV